MRGGGCSWLLGEKRSSRRMGWTTRPLRAKIVRAGEPRNIRFHPNSCAANTVVQQNKGHYEKQQDHER